MWLIKNFTTTHQASGQFLGMITMIFQKNQIPRTDMQLFSIFFEKNQITTYKTFGSSMNPDGSLRFLSNQNRWFFDSGF